MENVMEYKGYYGSINYSDDDEILYGKVLGLKNALILFEGKTVRELKKDFKESVDDYLELCNSKGIEPEKQCKGSLNVRLGVDLHTKAKLRAEQENISINELIKIAVSKYLEVV